MFPYTGIFALVNQIPNAAPYLSILNDHGQRMSRAQGSGHNHQAWEGGYLDHVQETMNIAVWLYYTCPRHLPFSLSEALEVMFLHDIEKPFAKELKAQDKYTKAHRKEFRANFIREYGIELTAEQENALRYVEGENDDYTPGKRGMGELAAFCHMCDIASARLWHDKGRAEEWINT